MTARAQDKRLWLAGGVVLAVIIALIGWFAVISPQRSAAASLKEQTEATELQNVVVRAKIGKLKRQNVPALTTSLRAAVAALPFDTGLPTFSRQLAAQAVQNHVALTNITVGGITSAGGTGTTATSGTAAAGGLLSIAITLNCTGTSVHRLGFLSAIQVDGPRRALVTSTQVSPAAGASIAGASTMTVGLTTFAAPMSAAAQAQLEKLLHGDVSK